MHKLIVVSGEIKIKGLCRDALSLVPTKASLQQTLVATMHIPVHNVVTRSAL